MPNPRRQSKPCTACQQRNAVAGNKYCHACWKLKLAEMRDAGYLTPKVYTHVGQNRGSEARELISETKFGRDG